jgi:hypothetical protein
VTLGRGAVHVNGASESGVGGGAGRQGLGR